MRYLQSGCVQKKKENLLGGMGRGLRAPYKESRSPHSMGQEELRQLGWDGGGRHVAPGRVAASRLGHPPARTPGGPDAKMSGKAARAPDCMQPATWLELQ